ncbi:hypothetical protein FACS1894147_03470 [Spirochaetia bacterium]|nr:hypothetical protein FACS1894147_03470 [Spirochaetia bacterium]
MVLVLVTTCFSCKANTPGNSAVERVTIGDYSFAKSYWKEWGVRDDSGGYAYIPYDYYELSEKRITTLIDIIKKGKIVSQAEADDIDAQLSSNPSLDMGYYEAFDYLRNESDISDDDKRRSKMFLEDIQGSEYQESPYRHYFELLPKNAEELENVKYIIKDSKRWKDDMSGSDFIFGEWVDERMSGMDMIKGLFPRIKNKVLFY